MITTLNESSDFKICTGCNKKFPEEEFALRYDKRYSRFTRIVRCRECEKAYRRKKRAPKQTRQMADGTRIEIVEIESKLRTQNNLCGICEKPITLDTCHTDHCHTTGIFRGVLCPCCNIGLGHLERPGFIEAATKYLRANSLKGK